MENLPSRLDTAVADLFSPHEDVATREAVTVPLFLSEIYALLVRSLGQLAGRDIDV